MAGGSVDGFLAMSTSMVHASRSLISLIAFSPALLSLYLPVGVCCRNGVRFRMWKLSLPVSMLSAFMRSVNVSSPFSLRFRRICLLMGCDSTVSIREMLSWLVAIFLFSGLVLG